MRRENGACCFVRDVRSDVAGGEGVGGERDWANKWSDLALSSDEPRHASPRWIISARRRQRRTRSAHTHDMVSSLLLHFFPFSVFLKVHPSRVFAALHWQVFFALPHFLCRCFSSISAAAQRSAAAAAAAAANCFPPHFGAARVGRKPKHPSCRADVSAWHDPRPKEPRRFFLLTERAAAFGQMVRMMLLRFKRVPD